MKNLSKRIVAFCLITLLALGASSALAASIDLSALSFDELIELSEQITKEITSRSEWKEVTVPAGLYEIGVDIPAGYWTITAADGDYAMIELGNSLNDAKSTVRNTQAHELITSKTSRHFDSSAIESVSWVMTDGQYFSIDSGSVVFTPYVKTPANLGF